MSCTVAVAIGCSTGLTELKAPVSVSGIDLPACFVWVEADEVSVGWEWTFGLYLPAADPQYFETEQEEIAIE